MPQRSSPANPDRLRILLLTSSTGGGHDSRAYSLSDWMHELAADEAEVRVAHLLEESAWLPRIGVEIYNVIQKRAPWLHNIYWHIAEAYAWSQGKHLTVGRDHYEGLLRDYQPHLIISVHDCLNRGYFQVAREVLGRAVRCATYCGEWSGGFGYSRNWVDPTADLFISRTSEAEEYAVELGMPRERCMLFCNLLPIRSFSQRMDEQARASFRETQLGLDPGKFTVLLATGQVGANNHLRFLDVLASRHPHTQAIAMCGRNNEIAARLEAWKAAHPDFRLFVEAGYSLRVHQLLEASDCVVTRGGSNTTAEALFHTCPVLFNKLGGVMPQERLTLNYFIGHGAAAAIGSVSEFDQQVGEWSRFSDAHTRAKWQLEKLRGHDHPRELIRRLLELASEATSRNAQ